MGVFTEEEELWKCSKHPSKNRRTGICPTCLRDRLINLCPDCANVRPCSCCCSTISFSSSSSSSSSSFSSDFHRSSSCTTGIGSIGRISNLIDDEPAFRRSRSTAFQIIRSRFSDKEVTSVEEQEREIKVPSSSRKQSSKSSSFWSIFKMNRKSKKIEYQNEKSEEEEEENEDEKEKVDDLEMIMKKKMMRSRSVGISCYSDHRDQIPASDVRFKGKSWYFPSPIKVFRQPKSSRIIQERSPLCRG